MGRSPKHNAKQHNTFQSGECSNPEQPEREHLSNIAEYRLFFSDFEPERKPINDAEC